MALILIQQATCHIPYTVRNAPPGNEVLDTRPSYGDLYRIDAINDSLPPTLTPKTAADIATKQQPGRSGPASFQEHEGCIYKALSASVVNRGVRFK